MGNDDTPAAASVHSHDCPMCGRSVSKSTGRGRPRTFCDPQCAETSKLMGWLQGNIDSLAGKLAASPTGYLAANKLRGEFAAMANLLNRAGTHAGNNPAACAAKRAGTDRRLR